MIIKTAIDGMRGLCKGVSTLDALGNDARIISLAVAIIVFCGSVFAGHSILDRVDPAFNPQIVTNLYGGKMVRQLETLQDGKILVFGDFTSYDHVPTGKLVRLNPDGSLDTTFNNQIITSAGNCDPRTNIVVQPDGKLILACRDMVANGQAPKHIIRLNADGTLDPSFNYTLGVSIQGIALDSLGRLAVHGGFQTPQGLRFIVRLNPDGSYDNSFNFTISLTTVFMTSQGSRVIVGDSRIRRLNEDGSEDTTFALSNPTGSISKLLTQPDNKILYVKGNEILRLNENGGSDSSFSPTTLALNGEGTMKLAADGKIVITSLTSSATYRRCLANGGEDPSFTPYTHLASAQGAFAIQPDGSIILGDGYTQSSTQGINNFIRLTPGGVPDQSFNLGGIAFQTILPGSIRSIEALSDGRVVLGGQFDVINNITRPKIARLLADSSVDPTFQINTSGTGDHFSQILDIYQLRALPNGKVVVSGWFDYSLNGVAKTNLVRLNSDGSIDPTFNLTQFIPDYSVINLAGRNHFVTLSDGSVVIGNSKNAAPEPTGPLKILEGGARDTSFISTVNSSSPLVYIDDVALQPDGKIVFGGSYNPDFGGHRTFLARLNANGSTDTSFTYSEEPGRLTPTLALLPTGKILVGKQSNGTLVGRIERFNADGTPDNTFNSLSIPNGVVNAVLSLPNGKIFVGGKFTVTVNGQQTNNLLRLDADGHIETTTYNVNDEVLCLAVDSLGRVLVGGSFTVIGANGGGWNRSYVARLTDSGTPFDYDGDGKSDISVFRASENKWYILQSSNGAVVEKVFAIGGDIATPADYDGDGKTDIAVYRPSSADWWSLSTINGHQAYAHWGEANVLARPSDFDGDGKSDYIFFLPANATWYRFGSRIGVSYITFGLVGDKPVTGDFNGDGKTDVAIYRPSTGDWWWQSSADNVQRATHWGISTDVPAPADYDGDGKTDFAVYRPSNGTWYIYNSSNLTTTALNFGLAGDKPVPADYDGDGKADIAVFRPSTGVWYLMKSTAGFAAVQFGVSTDIPTPNVFVP